MNEDMFFDLRGNIRILVVGADEKDLAMVRQHLGVAPAVSVGREVNITLRFVEQLTPDKMNYIGINQYGYTDQDFYLLNLFSGKAEVRIPLDQIGEKCEIVCQRGIPRIPLMTEILKITFLKHNIISLHASAVVFKQNGVVVMGWVRGGKTSALLAYMQQGAKFIGDDWILYDLEKEQIFGFPGALSISYYHLQQMSIFWSRVGISKRVYLKGLKLIINLLRPAAHLFKVKKLRKLVLKLREKLRVDLRPEDIFASRNIVEHFSPRKFLLMTSHNQKKIEVQKISLEELVDVFVHANEYDLIRLHETYLAYGFAFPDRRNLFLEKRRSIESHLLKKALAGKELIRIFHPYPLPLRAFIEEVIENSWDFQ